MISIANLEYFVSTYGYLAILLGTFIEGETILVVGGFAAHLGYLQLPYVMASAFLGSFMGDQFFFIIGRLKGQVLLSKFRRVQKRVDKIHVFLHRYNDLIMVGFRFVYGIRVLTPVVLGMNHKVKAGRFFIFNALGALVWSVVISAGGYLFGEALQMILKDFRKYQFAIMLGMMIMGFLGWLLHRLVGNGKNH
jgi:membrane protein DedA with SNARE-associated domain